MNRRPAPPPQVTVRRGRGWVWPVGGVALVGLALAVGWNYGFGPAADLSAAEAALARHDPAAARPFLDRRLRWWPSDQRTLFLAARAARRCDAYADAERFLTTYEAEHGKTEEYKLEWALLGIQQGDYVGDASRFLNSTSSTHPDAAFIQEAVAKGTRALVRYTDAVAVFTNLIERTPDDGPAYVQRGELLDLLHQRPEVSVKDFQKAVELLPVDIEARLALADHRARTGHTREAIAHYEWVLTGRPGEPRALLGLGRAWADGADLAAAASRLDDLLAAHPDHADGLTERARVALRQDRPELAESLLERATRVAPWSRNAARLHALALSELNRTEAAAKAKARVAELVAEDGLEGKLKFRADTDPRDVTARWELYRWGERNGLEADARAWLFEILQADPRYEPAHTELAKYYDRVGQPRRAAEHRAAIGRP